MTTHCRVSSVESRVITAKVGRGVPTAPLRPDAFLTGNLTPSNGLPNGSDFCKSLQSRKVYGLTGKIPPGSPLGLTCPTCPTGLTSSNPVQPNPTKSNQIQPGPPLYPQPPTLGL
jgi:hypothetical protein